MCQVFILGGCSKSSLDYLRLYLDKGFNVMSSVKYTGQVHEVISETQYHILQAANRDLSK